MSLGQNIYRLRTQREMSQLSLAEELGVSRQSISKWETDASVPELEKLIKLSQLFGVSLDELVAVGRDDPGAPSQPFVSESPCPPCAPPTTKSEPQYIYVKSSSSGRKTAGIILLCMGFLVLLLLSFLGAFAGGLIFASPFIVCGLICLCVKRLPGLWCAWALYFLITLYLQYATGITWAWVFSIFFWKDSDLNIQMLISLLLLIFLIILALTTAWCLRRPHIELKENRKKPIITATVIVSLRIVFYFLFRAVNEDLIHSSPVPHFALAALSTVSMCISTVLFTALLTLVSRCINWKC